MSGVECIDGVKRSFTLRYPYLFDDGGRSTSKRPRQSYDCTVRAVAVACGMDYDVVYDLIAQAGRKCARGFDFRVIAAGGVIPGWNFTWEAYPAVKGQWRMNPASFCDVRPKGRWVIRVAKHVAAVIDGVLHDDSPMRPNRCIYGAWWVTARMPRGGSLRIEAL